ncbi:MAG: sensor histidine kinase, partial [Spirochaetota bacterium]
SALQAFSARQRIQLQLDLDDIPLDSSKAFPLGAILTELLTNAIKYAYPEQEVGVVEISLKHDGSSAVLTVRDNGRGFPEALDPETTESFGLDLVRSLAQQIEGSAKVDTQHGAGTRATVRFPAARRRA